jgi:YHS domain-containing protein
MRIFSSCSTALICFWVFILLACSAPIAPINVDADGAALKGYDPVAYFTLGHPVKGQKKYQYEWNNANWLFASSEHLTLFQENPSTYAPQYGGY